MYLEESVHLWIAGGKADFTIPSGSCTFLTRFLYRSMDHCLRTEPPGWGSFAHFISSSGICRIFPSSVPAENKTSTRVRTPPSLKPLLTADNRPSRVIYGPQSLLPFLQAFSTPWKTCKVYSYHMILWAAVKPTLSFAQISTCQTSFPASFCCYLFKNRIQLW